MKNILTYLCLFSVLASCGQEKKEMQKTNTKKKETMKLTDKEWKDKLSPEQYYILREKGTERPFSGKLLLNKEKGVYKCAACGADLFTDDMKFDAHCGWPSFDREIAGGKIKQSPDNSAGMSRTEITCAKCGGHLGHIFADGPTSTGVRYCVNSLSLTFQPTNATSEQKTEKITLAGGCFWCQEAIFDSLKGVIKAESGYCGGHKPNPTYEEVCTGTTGHAEVIQVSYNPNQISVQELLEVFFALHNPTTLNRQGADVGTQYRSAIFYHNENQKQIAQRVIETLIAEKVYADAIVTEIKPIDVFYKAENYHQNYYSQNQQKPYCKATIEPKIAKLHKVFKKKLK